MAVSEIVVENEEVREDKRKITHLHPMQTADNVPADCRQQ